jgi:hypothetical protein
MYNKKFGPSTPKTMPKVDTAAARARMQERAQARTMPRPTDVGRKSGMTRAEVASQRAGQQAAAQGQTVTAGRYPGTMQDSVAASTKTMPRDTRLSLQNARFKPVGNQQVATLPQTDQAKMLEWAKANPVLAGGGGLLGYKMLNSNNNDNIVVAPGGVR